MKLNRTRLLVLLLGGLVCIGFVRFIAYTYGGPLLHNAVRDEHTTQTQLLVYLGCDPNYRTGSGSPLHYAAASGDVAMIQFLLRHEARVDSQVKFGVTPLWEARFNHNSEAERVLLAHGANPDASQQSVGGCSPRLSQSPPPACSQFNDLSAASPFSFPQRTPASGPQRRALCPLFVTDHPIRSVPNLVPRFSPAPDQGR